MNIHEYQAKELLRKYDVPVPKGGVASKLDEVEEIIKKLAGDVFVVKAQIHAGGRGKGGGVKIARSISEVKSFTKNMLGMNLVTHQTGPQGKKVQKVLIEEGVDISRELYLGIVIDRSISRLVIMASTEGGVEIEKVAEENPDAILKAYIDPSIGIQQFQARKIAFGLGLSGNQVKGAVKFILGLYKVFVESDASLAEINPLVVTRKGDVLALDAKMNFDDSALYRHPDILAMRDLNEEDSLEVEAARHHLNYIKLDGSVGCMVNGAGLAMATMDIIKYAGSMPANFLDVGGSANVETVRNGFNIILSDSNVKAILINIFGGIVRCDRVAKGIIEAATAVKIDLPIIIRLAGTNAKEAAVLLHNSAMNFEVADTLKDAAIKVVRAINK